MANNADNKPQLTLTQRIKRLVNMGHDKAPEDEIIKSIEEGTEFHGAKLWILVLAIFVASLGLNTNSAAVIIGAMLISPLMGPILGMGLGVGIYDFELLKQALRNYAVTTLFSVLTAFIYFSISPLTEAQSELLARTSPTIYDVCIALCGGLAGIVALSSKSQRTGNVIPGVAIATALMPPLCTVGYGLALGKWAFAAGAFYLYLINTVFIATSTFIGVSFILKMHKKKQVDAQRAKRVRRIILTIACLTVIPSIYITLGIVRDTVFEQHVRQFVQQEVDSKHKQAHLLSYTASRHEQTLRLVLLGQALDSVQIHQLQDALPQYSLNQTKLIVVQGQEQLSANDIRSLIQHESNLAQQFEADQQISDLQQQLEQSREHHQLAIDLFPEVRALYPDVQDFSLLRGVSCYQQDTLSSDSTLTLAIVRMQKRPAPDAVQKMQAWLQQRTRMANLHLMIEQ